MTRSVIEFEVVPPDWPLTKSLDLGVLRWRGVSLAVCNRYLPGFPIECEPFENTPEKTWKASRWVGEFAIGEERYAIAPRIGWPRFHAMLSSVLSVGTLGQGGLRWSPSGEADLTPLAWVLEHENAWRCHRGPAKAFVRREIRQSPELRGELDLAAQLTKLEDRHTLACRYDDLTFDHPVNRGARLALRQLAHHERFPFNGKSDFRRLCRGWQDALAVNDVTMPEYFPADTVRWSRANDGFRTAHGLAEQLAAERQNVAAVGKQQNAYLFDSAEVWELFLLHQLREAIADIPGHRIVWPRERLAQPDRLLIWNGKLVSILVPDFQVVRDDDTVALVIDAKYRHFVPPYQDAEVAIQLFKYGASAKRRAGESGAPVMLLYPSCEALNPGNGAEQFELGRGSLCMQGNPTISAWALPLPDLDLNVSPAVLSECVQGQLRKLLMEYTL